MRIVEVPHGPVQEYGSQGVWMFFGPAPQQSSAVRLHVAHFEPGGTLGRHPTRLWQVFWVIGGAGCVAGQDEVVVPITAGQAAVWEPGEDHQSWADEPMTVLILQSRHAPQAQP
jgi:hypothetical protein